MGTLTEVFSNFLLFFLVFGMSATVDIDKLRKQLRNKHALLTGVSMQFLVLPFVGFVVVKIFGFSAPVGITLLVVTSSPGGSYSNWWCSLFNAELALSVTMTALSTMVSVVMLPVNLIIYASGSYSSAVVKSLDWYALFMSLFVVIGGISSGLFCSAYFKDSPGMGHKMRKAANRFGNLSGMCLVAYSILVSSSDHKAALWDQSWDFFVGLAIPAVVGITTATLLATRFDLEKPERVAVAVESCYQNTGIATSVAAVMFDTTEDDLATALSVTVYYGMVEMFLLATFCVLCWKAGWTKAPSHEKFCVVISTSYEVEQGEAEDQAASIDVVMGGISRSDDNDEDCEKVKDNVGPPKPPLIFEESDATEDESECSGAVVLRKVDTTETICSEASLSPPRGHEDTSGNKSPENSPSPSNQLSVSEVEPPSPSGSLSGSLSDEGDPEQQVDGDGKESGQVGRFGKTISFVKARATGYRRAPLPMGDSDGEDDQIIAPSPVRRGTGYQRAPLPNADSDGEDDHIIPPSQREPETGIAQSAEIADLEECRRKSSSHSLSPNKAAQRAVDRVPAECPSPPLTSRSRDESEATPADGKTID